MNSWTLITWYLWKYAMLSPWPTVKFVPAVLSAKCGPHRKVWHCYCWQGETWRYHTWHLLRTCFSLIPAEEWKSLYGGRGCVWKLNRSQRWEVMGINFFLYSLTITKKKKKEFMFSFKTWYSGFHLVTQNNNSYI